MTQLAPNPQLFVNGVEASDVIQGILGGTLRLLYSASDYLRHFSLCIIVEITFEHR